MYSRNWRRPKKNAKNYPKARDSCTTGPSGSAFWSSGFLVQKCIPILSECVGIVFVPPDYPMGTIPTGSPCVAQSGYHLRTGPKMALSQYSEITYLRNLIPEVSMSKPTYTTSERTVSSSD